MKESSARAAAAIRYHVREASPDDVPALAALYRQEVEFHRRLARYYDVEPAFDWIAFVRFKLRRGNRTVFVAETEGRLVGFIYVRVIRLARPKRAGRWLRLLPWRGGSPPGLPIQPSTWGSIEDCFVIDGFRRQGIGVALVGRAREWFRDRRVRRIELAVLENNPRARRFWEKLGFATFRLSMARDCA